MSESQVDSQDASASAADLAELLWGDAPAPAAAADPAQQQAQAADPAQGGVGAAAPEAPQGDPTPAAPYRVFASKQEADEHVAQTIRDLAAGINQRQQLQEIQQLIDKADEDPEAQAELSRRFIAATKQAQRQEELDSHAVQFAGQYAENLLVKMVDDNLVASLTDEDRAHLQKVYDEGDDLDLLTAVAQLKVQKQAALQDASAAEAANEERFQTWLKAKDAGQHAAYLASRSPTGAASVSGPSDDWSGLSSSGKWERVEAEIFGK